MVRSFGCVLACVLVLSCSAQALHAAEYDVNWDGTGDFTTIQAAIDAAVDGDLIIVHPGTYYENIHFDGKNITLRSLDPEDEAIVASTVIDGGQDGSVVTFEGTEGEVCLLSGFTITNGRAYQGGGISGTDPAMDPQLPAHASIANCVITRNTVAYTGGSSGGYGGGLYYCDGEISNCTITGNSAAGTGAAAGGGLAYCYGQISNCTISGNWADYGGGVSDCEGTVSNCTISGNWAHGGGGLQWCAGTISNCTISGNAAIGVYASGGGLDRCYGTISDCTISGNYAGEAGGGLYGCSAELINCRITSNSAPNGAGLSECSGEIRNCTISGNSASGIGGGLSYCDGPISFCTIIGNVADYDGGAFYFCTGTITNCTISGNSARWGGGLCHCGVTITNCTITQNSARELGGGLYGCYGTITGCIIWGNEAEQGRELHLCQSLVEYSCIRDRTVGEGNISDDPLFVKGPLGDYYLSCRAAGQDADSPCIDAGSDTAESLDLDKFTTRTDYVLDSGVVDMGYHYPLMLDQKPQIECSLNSSEFRPGDTLVGFIEAQNRGLDVAVDAYIAFVLPNGEIISLTASGLSMGTYPWVSNVVLPSGLHFGPTEVFRMMVPDCPGSYLFAAGLTEPGRSEFIGEPNLFPFTIRDFLLRVRIPERDCRR